jgi:predicted nuclease of predicted toxin-antitoxin system
MPRTIRFHLDENCSTAIATGLRRRGIDVTTTPEANLRGAIDESQLAFCLSEGRVIFSYDDDLLRLAAAGFEHAGIVYCQQRKRRVGDVVRGLELIWERLEPREMSGQVKYI